MDAREKALRTIDDTVSALPDPPDKPLAVWSPAQILSDNTRLALLRQREILINEITPDMDVKEKRLIADVAATVEKIGVRVQEAAMRQPADDEARFDEMMRLIRKHQAERGS